MEYIDLVSIAYVFDLEGNGDRLAGDLLAYAVGGNDVLLPDDSQFIGLELAVYSGSSLCIEQDAVYDLISIDAALVYELDFIAFGILSAGYSSLQDCRGSSGKRCIHRRSRLSLQKPRRYCRQLSW